LALPVKNYIKSGAVHSKGRTQNAQEIILLSFLGYRNKDICKRLGYTASWVSTIIQSPEGQKALETLRASKESNATNLVESMRETLTKHKDVLDKILSDDEVLPSLKAQVVFKLMDRVGAGPMQTITHQTSEALTGDEISEINAKIEAEYNIDSIELAETVDAEEEKEVEVEL
jgi:predicted transcriptional regulator